jgi:signal transduction histidine kinase/ligand-binding sensor domain-containing protein
MASFDRPASRWLRGWAWMVCLLASAPAAQAQSRLDSWAVEDGLPQNSVNDILQTRDGYLWLATFGGLVRFDGVRFVVFDRSVEGVGSLRVRTLLEDRSGTLWAGTEDGMLIRHREGRFTTFATADGLPPESALRIDEDGDGHLWITWLETVTRYNGARFVNFGPGDFERGVRNHTKRVAMGRHVVWWSQDAQGLHCLVGGRVRTCLTPDQLRADRVADVKVDRGGSVWVRTETADLIQIKPSGRRRLLSMRDGIPGDIDAMFYEDRHGSLWVREFAGDSYRVTNGRRTMVTRYMFSIYEDREGSIWIGTPAGLQRVRDLSISHLTTRDGLSSDNVYSILRDTGGDIWIGTWGAGLNRYAHGRFTAYRIEHGLQSDYVTAVYEDPSGRLWVGTSSGVAYLERGRFRAYEAPDGLLSGNVWAMLEDASGDFWFGTDGGLVCRRNGQFTRYTAADGLAHDSVITLHRDRGGALWIGTGRGVSRLRNGTFTSYSDRDGLVGNAVRAFHDDADGVMWIGTYDGGLYRLDGGRLTRYTTQSGLHDNGVFQILDDGAGHLWMGSNRGISRVSRRELHDYAAGRLTSIRATVFGLRDGLSTLECNGGRQPSGLRMHDGTLWIPTQGGIAVVDPKAVRPNAIAPPVLIEALRLQGDTVSFRGGVSARPHQDSFEIRYTALSFVKPEQVRFKYRLVGLDEDWIDAGDRRTAAYYRIPPGSYEFQVMAANSDGVWSRAADRVPIVILAPVWRRTWFLATAAMLLLGLVVVIDRRRAGRQRIERERQRAYARQLLETQESERRRISNDLHDSLGQSLLLVRAEARAAGTADADSARALDRISTLAGQAYTDMREIAYNLRPYHLDKIGVSRTIEGLLQRVNGSCGVEFESDVADIDDAVPRDAAIGVYRIVQEGVSNIVRHSGATRARVAIRRDNGAVEIEIADNGRGFQPPSRTVPGTSTGFGLMGIQERARSLNGRAAVRSKPGRGTTIVVRFPSGAHADA